MDEYNISLFGGSQWRILPDCILNDVWTSVHKKDCLYRIVKSIYGPDETFFQTMIMNGQCANLVEVNETEKILQNCKTYALFSKEGYPNVGYLYVITNKDKLLIMDIKKNLYFVRKFDISKAEEII